MAKQTDFPAAEWVSVSSYFHVLSFVLLFREQSAVIEVSEFQMLHMVVYDSFILLGGFICKWVPAIKYKVFII